MSELLTFLLLVFGVSVSVVAICVTLLVCGSAFYIIVLLLGRMTDGY